MGPSSRVPLADEPDVSAIVTEDGAAVDNWASEKQMRLLTEPLYTSWPGPPPLEDGVRRPFVVVANVGLFPAVNEPPLVPDVFLSADVQAHQDLWRKDHRSYFFWKFGKPPEVVIEIVSGREGDELGHKKRRYARMRIAHYVVWDPGHHLGETELRCFELRGELLVAARAPVFEALGLALVEWRGVFEHCDDRWLRWATLDGALIPTGAESADAERQRADSERQRADSERQRADTERQRLEADARKLRAKLLALGVDPDSGD